MQNSSTAASSLWRNALPETRTRLHLLQTAADDLARSRTMEPDQRTAAAATAHDLASALSLFGLREAALLARDAEATLDQPGLPQPERLQQQVEALQAALKPHLSSAD